MNRYRVKYTNKRGKPVSRVVMAKQGDKARSMVKNKYKGKNVKVNLLGKGKRY